MLQMKRLRMKAYRSPIYSVTKYSPAYVVPGSPLSLPIDCFKSTPQTAIYATPSDYVFRLKLKLRKTHQLKRQIMDDEQERQKTCHDRSRYRPSYKVGEEISPFNPSVTKGETLNLLLSIAEHTQ